MDDFDTFVLSAALRRLRVYEYVTTAVAFVQMSIAIDRCPKNKKKWDRWVSQKFWKAL
jgi:hypothetical protein